VRGRLLTAGAMARPTVLSFLKYVGCLQNTVYQDPLHNKRLHFNWLTFLHLFIVYMDH
jgi:hypothetical protein